jgi:protocatechuate 3,4-dioxygenase beta subunit
MSMNPNLNKPDEEDDDKPVGRVLSRREALALFGVAGAVGLVAQLPVRAILAQTPSEAQVDYLSYLPLIAKAEETATPTPTTPPTTTPFPTATFTPVPTGTITAPACVVRPDRTEGPYFVDEKWNRSDIRSDPTTNVVKAGTQLTLSFRVTSVANGGCAVLPNAQVDIWHCDAGGLYSDESANNTVGQKFLRGYQLSDSGGLAKFVTIYPGWYSGRTVHIHFKIRMNAYEFTSQLFVDDTLTDTVFQPAPYNTRGTRNTRNANDGIYNQNNTGGQLLLALTQNGSAYDAVFDIGVNVA